VRLPLLGLRSIAAGALLASCGTLPDGRGWGQDATIAPGWERVRKAAVANLEDPVSWLPIASAAVLQIDDWDRRISDWARDETPIFGSTGHAEDASDTWRTITSDLWTVSVFAPPSGDSFGEWAWSRAKGATVEIVAKAASRGVTSVLKDVSNRTRPDGADDRSFPSGHMTEAFGSAVLGSSNLDNSDLPPGLVWPGKIALYGSSILTGWARVEAGKHFPSDVLFAAGATNFIVGFVHDAFLGLGASPEIVVSVLDDGWELGLRWNL